SCGAAAAGATREFYAGKGMSSIPMRGPLAANTVAGTISGWDLAFQVSREWGGTLSLQRLLADAIAYARDGIPVTRSQAASTSAKFSELHLQPGFADTFLVDGSAPAEGSVFRQPRLAATLERLAEAGLRDFYEGDLAKRIAADLERIGSPLRAGDLARRRAALVTPVALRHSRGMLYTMTPPTQGVISLAILGALDRLGVDQVDPLSADYIHLCVEATKQAFLVRDAYVTDPAYMRVEAQSLLDPGRLDAMAGAVDRYRALSWGGATEPGDTIWMGVIDGGGRAVSFIQSIYHEFGSGVVLADTGINWQNRGCSFSLDPQALNALEPGRKPFHTLN